MPDKLLLSLPLQNPENKRPDEGKSVSSIFDILTLFLVAAAVGLFLLRLRHEMPHVLPYLTIALIGLVGNWLGNQGGGVAAVALLMSGAFLMLHLAGEPYREPTGHK